MSSEIWTRPPGLPGVTRDITAHLRRSCSFCCLTGFLRAGRTLFQLTFLADDPAAVADLSGFERPGAAAGYLLRADIHLNDGVRPPAILPLMR